MKNQLLYTITALVLFCIPNRHFAQSNGFLQTAAGYVLFTSNGQVTNTGSSQITGNVGTNAGTNSGFGNTNGQIHSQDASTLQASRDVDTAYNILGVLPCDSTIGASLGSGQVLRSKVYCISSAATLSGNLFLDAQGNPDAIFIIKINGGLTSTTGANVFVLNGTQSCRIFWRVNGPVNLAANTGFTGTIVGNGAITLGAGTNIDGRALTKTGAVTVSGISASVPVGCGSPKPSGPQAPNFNFAICYSIYSSSGSLTNVGPSVVVGDIGTNNGYVTGYDTALVTGGMHYGPDSSTAQVALDLNSAYSFLNNLSYNVDLIAPTQFGGGQVLTPHVYRLNGNTILTDSVTLDAQGNPGATFVFLVNGTFTANAGAKIKLAGGARASNIFWKIEGATTLNAGSALAGTLLVHNGAITLGSGTTVNGRTFTMNGAINSTITNVYLPTGYGPCGSPITNDAPTALNDTLITTPKNTPVIIHVTANDSDPNNDPLTVSIITGPAHGTTTVVGNDVLYTPDSGFVGLDSFYYRICDNGNPALCDSAKVYIIVGPNLKPTAVDDYDTTSRNKPVLVDVLANDNDPDGDPLTLVIITQPVNGTVAIVGKKTLYTPNTNFIGLDSFQYRICDNGPPVYCDSAWVYITVVPNRSPDAVRDVLTVCKNTVAVLNILSNDIEPDADSLTITILTQPLHATLTVSGSVNYNPVLNYLGADSFQYQICDNGSPVLCDSAWAVISVVENQAPVANDDYVSTLKNVPVTIHVTANDSDPCGDPLTVSIIRAPMNGTASVVSGTDIYYAPYIGYVGKDSILYKICDNGTPTLCDSAWVYITVINNRPPVAVDDTVQTHTNTPVSINVTANDFDPDGDPLSVSIITNPNNGTAFLNGNNIVYTPNVNFLGPDSIFYRICDNGNPVLCDSAWVHINTTVNNPPVAVNDFATVLRNTPELIKVTANDSDPDGDPLTVSIITPGAFHGSVVVVGNDVRYTPALAYVGPDSFQYQICDNGNPSLCDSAWVFINVVTNRAPVAVDDFTTTIKNTAVTVNVTANDSDPDGNTLTVTLVTPSKNGTDTVIGNNVRYTPNNNYLGADSIQYRICDNGSPSLCATAWVHIDVLNNRPPVAVNDFVTVIKNTPIAINVTSNDSDPDGDPISVNSIITAARHGSTTITGNLVTYNPANSYIGTDSFEYRLCDKGNPVMCSTAWVYLNVISVVGNRAPVAIRDAVLICQNSSPVTIFVQSNDSDPDLDLLTTAVLTTPQHGTATLSNNAIVYTPTTGYAGKDSLLYSVCDNGVPSLCATAYVIISINPIPASLPSTQIEVCEGQGVIIGKPSVAGNSYTWSPITGLSSPVISQPLATPSTTTTYTLTETITSTGCSTISPVTVVVNAKPAAYTGPNRTLYRTTSFQIGAPPVPGHVYVWSPATGLNSTVSSQPLVYTDFTTTYTLTETDTNTGCTNTNTVTISVVPLEFYNAFSPNGDGKNDFWKIPMFDIYTENEVVIINRWGTEVWSTTNYNNYNNFWSGTNRNGAELPDGSYYYILKFLGNEKRGWVLIKR